MRCQILNCTKGFCASNIEQAIVSQNLRTEKRNTMSAFHREKVLSVRHWTDTLLSFRATRNSGFRFQNGQFAQIGVEVEGRPLLRAYSMASANHEDELEFFSIKSSNSNITPRVPPPRPADTVAPPS